jgi:hypothetical protein
MKLSITEQDKREFNAISSVLTEAERAGLGVPASDAKRNERRNKIRQGRGYKRAMQELNAANADMAGSTVTQP